MIRRQKSPVPADEGNEESESSEEMFKQAESYSWVSDAPSKLQKTSSNTNEEQGISDESVFQQRKQHQQQQPKQQQQNVEFPESAEMPSIQAVVEASFLSTDTLPLEPREVTEPIEWQHIAELKEQDTACGVQAIPDDVSCVTYGGKHPCESVHEFVHEETQSHHIEELKEPDRQCSSKTNDATNQNGFATSSEVVSTSRSVDKTFSYNRTTNPSDGTTIIPNSTGLKPRQQPTSNNHETTPTENLREVTPHLNWSVIRNVGNPRIENVQQYHVPLKEPPSHWEYNKMLVDLNKMITSPHELNTMKYRFKNGCDEGGFGKGVLEKIIQPMDLFRKMEECLYLNKNNIIYLQEILRTLDRPELLAITTDYCSKIGGVLHVQNPSHNQVNFSTYAKFNLHLDKEYSSYDLATLKNTVARILGVNVNSVLVVDVEPPNSLRVTLMLPETYDMDHLRDRLAELGVDTATINDKVCRIEAGTNKEARSSDKQPEDMDTTCFRLEQNLAERTAQLTEAEERCKKLMAEKEILEKQNEDKSSLLVVYEQLFTTVEYLEKQALSSDAFYRKKQDIERIKTQDAETTARLKDSKNKQTQLMTEREMIKKKHEASSTILENRYRQIRQIKENMEKQPTTCKTDLRENKKINQRTDGRVERRKHETMARNLDTQFNQLKQKCLKLIARNASFQK